jgi:hypothetical protein
MEFRERFELRLDRRLLGKLKAEAAEKGTSVAEIVRESLENRYVATREERIRAARELCLVDTGSEEWPALENQIEEEHIP